MPSHEMPATAIRPRSRRVHLDLIPPSGPTMRSFWGYSRGSLWVGSGATTLGRDPLWTTTYGVPPSSPAPAARWNRRKHCGRSGARRKPAARARGRDGDGEAVTGALLLAILVLVLVNAFFVAAEFSLVSARKGQLRGQSLAARLARRQQDKLDEYLSACQLGITIASLALGAVGEQALAALIEPVLHSVALANVAAVLGSVLALLLLTAVHITVGEQAPKSFAIGSPALEVFHRTLRPLVVVLNNASNGIVRLLGGTPASSHAQQASLEELRQLIGGLTDEGHLDVA